MKEYFRCEVPSWMDTVLFLTFPVIRETKCGVYIDCGKRKFICESRAGRKVYKRYAWPTKKEALESFIARKQAQLEYLDRQAKLAERGMSIAIEESTIKLITDGRK